MKHTLKFVLASFLMSAVLPVAIAQVTEDFDSYANQAALDAAWTAQGTAMTLTTTNRSASGANSIYQGTDAQESWKLLPSPIEAGKLNFNFSFYDPVGAGSLARTYGMVYSRASDSWAGALNQIIAVGKWNQIADSGHATYHGRVAFGAQNWVKLDDPGAPLRTEGWHTARVLGEASGPNTIYRFYIDGILSKTVTSTVNSNFNFVVMGSALTSAHGMWFDDVQVASGLGIVVPGTATPYLAGLPDGTQSSLGAPEPPDTAPWHSPVPILGVAFSTNTALSFRASGAVLHSAPRANRPFDPPDGLSTGVTAHRNGAEHGISDLRAPIDALVGVFLGAESPELSPAPYPLNFSTPESRDYSVLIPQLKQVFFIGDGLRSDGSDQFVIPPFGGTRLYLAVMDAYGWANNRGQFTVSLGFSNLVPPFSISPAAVDIFPGATTVFTASGGVPPYTFAWVVNNSGGSLSNGIYTAGETAGMDTISATDALGSNALAQVTVSILKPMVQGAVAGPGDPLMIWRASAAEFVLESATNMAPPIHWSEVTNEISGDAAARSYAVRNDSVATLRFYRLRRATPLDTDLDGLPDEVELILALNARKASTFNDGVWDGNRDGDADGLSNGWEHRHGLNPASLDSNTNGVLDGAEDSDLDSLTHAQEQTRGTDPLRADSDNDGWPDGVEIEIGNDPLSATSRPPVFVVASPPVQVVLPSLKGAGVLPLNTIVAQPPAVLTLPRLGDANLLPLNTTMALPPISIALPRLGDASLLPLNTTIALPPISIALPRLGDSNTLSLNTTIAQPPVQVEWSQP